jgi:hypothetical protein
MAPIQGEKLGFIKVHEHHNNYSTPNTDDLSAAEIKYSTNIDKSTGKP